MARKRLFSLTYEATGRPVYLEDAGQLLKISGILLQGMDESFLVLMPTACEDDLGRSSLHGSTIRPSLEEWCELLRQTDDPQVFEEDETGTVKAVHRKVQFAISGAVQQKVWARDKFRCLYCGKRMGDTQLTVDHFVPLERGGGHDISNYVSACRACNKRKGSILPEEYCKKNRLDYEGLCLYLRDKCSLDFVAHLT